MPVPTNVQHEKNIWIAAGDGDLDRVRVCVDPPSPYFSTAETISAGLDREPLSVRSPELSRHEMFNVCLALSANVPDENTYTPM